MPVEEAIPVFDEVGDMAYEGVLLEGCFLWFSIREVEKEEREKGEDGEKGKEESFHGVGEELKEN